MDFGLVELTPEQEAFAAEVQSVLKEIINEDVLEKERREGHGFNLEVHKALSERGWVWPEFLPQDRQLDRVKQRILEIEKFRFNYPSVTAGTTRLVWAAVERFGQPDLVEELRAGMLAGDVRFCLGYTEPDGGSDIAGAKTKAVRDGDEWIINGSKMFTTGAQNCQYTFLITRTDPELPKHKGLTMFLVPLHLPGVEIQAIKAFSGERTNIVYYDDVHVPDRYRLGNVNDGWSVLHGPLDEEHNMGTHDDLANPSMGTNFLYHLERALRAAAEWANTPGPDGSKPADDPTVLATLGKVWSDIEAGHVTPGPLGRIKGSDVLADGAATLHDLVGPLGVLSEGVADAPGNGAIDFAHRFSPGTGTYGGTVEVFKNIIAQHVLQLPRPNYPGSKTFIASGRGKAVITA